MHHRAYLLLKHTAAPSRFRDTITTSIGTMFWNIDAVDIPTSVSVKIHHFPATMDSSSSPDVKSSTDISDATAISGDTLGETLSILCPRQGHLSTRPTHKTTTKKKKTLPCLPQQLHRSLESSILEFTNPPLTCASTTDSPLKKKTFKYKPLQHASSGKYQWTSKCNCTSPQTPATRARHQTSPTCPDIFQISFTLGGQRCLTDTTASPDTCSLSSQRVALNDAGQSRLPATETLLISTTWSPICIPSRSSKCTPMTSPASCNACATLEA